ncbi:hypothetical protein ACX12E_17030 [Paenibacillus vandeheii]
MVQVDELVMAGLEVIQGELARAIGMKKKNREEFGYRLTVDSENRKQYIMNWRYVSMKVVPRVNFKENTTVKIDGNEFKTGYVELGTVNVAKGLSSIAITSKITDFVMAYLTKGKLEVDISSVKYSFKMEDVYSVEFIIKGEE